jgi:hypothetical protein
MLKKLGMLTLALVAIGVGFSLYLPPYSPEGATVTTAQPRFTLIKDSLNTPFIADSLRSSQQVFSSDTDKETVYGLQLGIFGSLQDAIAGAENMNGVSLELLITPTIFKVENQKRHWIVLALGPFNTQDEALRYQRLLNDHYIVSKRIAWPAEPEQ